MKILPSFYKNKHVLVTGGAGFIGSHVTEKLVECGAHVYVLDDLSTGSVHNLQSVLHKIHLTVGDVTNYETCQKATKHKDVVFHLAAFVSVPESVKCPAICEKVNADGTHKLLEACHENSVKKFVYSSSSAIYGNNTKLCSEDNDPNPESPYAKYKLKGEELCKEFSDKHNMETAILRYFNVYGDRQNANGAYAAVVAKFKTNLINKEPVVIYGDGKQTRDFIHVSEVVEANLLIATINSLKGDIYNIGSGKSISVLKLLKNLEKEENIKVSDIVFKPARSGDILISKASCKKYQGLKRKFA